MEFLIRNNYRNNMFSWMYYKYSRIKKLKTIKEEVVVENKNIKFYKFKTKLYRFIFKQNYKISYGIL